MHNTCQDQREGGVYVIQRKEMKQQEKGVHVFECARGCEGCMVKKKKFGSKEMYISQHFHTAYQDEKVRVKKSDENWG